MKNAMQIIEDVCRVMPGNVQPSEVMAWCREKPVVLVRDACIYALRNLTPLSYPEIARLLQHKSHASIIAAMRRAEANPEIVDIVDVMPKRRKPSLKEVLSKLSPEVFRQVIAKLYPKECSP